jgi:hypothetical protein
MAKFKDLKIVCKKCGKHLITLEKYWNNIKNMGVDTEEEKFNFETKKIEKTFRLENLPYLSHYHVNCLECGEVWGDLSIKPNLDLINYAKMESEEPIEDYEIVLSKR